LLRLPELALLVEKQGQVAVCARERVVARDGPAVGRLGEFGSAALFASCQFDRMEGSSGRSFNAMRK
jgi:hypothetical protein